MGAPHPSEVKSLKAMDGSRAHPNPEFPKPYHRPQALVRTHRESMRVHTVQHTVCPVHQSPRRAAAAAARAPLRSTSQASITTRRDTVLSLLSCPLSQPNLRTSAHLTRSNDFHAAIPSRIRVLAPHRCEAKRRASRHEHARTLRGSSGVGHRLPPRPSPKQKC